MLPRPPELFADLPACAPGPTLPTRELGAQRVLMPNRSQMEFRASDLERIGFGRLCGDVKPAPAQLFEQGFAAGDGFRRACGNDLQFSTRGIFRAPKHRC